MANNKKTKKGIIVDKKKTNNSAYLSKKRSSNPMDNWFTKFVIILMALSFVVGSIITIILYLF